MIVDDVASRVEKRVRGVLLLLSVVCAILPTTVILFAIDAQNKSTMLSHDQTVVDAYASELSSSIGAVRRQLESAALFLSANPGASALAHSMLQALLSSNKGLLQVTYFDAHGEIVGSLTVAGRHPLVLAPSTALAFHRSGSLRYLSFAVKTQTAGSGVLAAGFDMTSQQAQMQKLADSNQGRAFLVSDTKETLLSSSGSAVVPCLTAAILSGHRVVAAARPGEGRICFVTSKKVVGTPWRLVFSRQAPLLFSLRFPLLLSVGAALFAFVMALASILIVHRTSLDPARRRLEMLSMNSRSLENTVRQTELLLRETHHRVKNDLQILSSLLGLSDRPGLDLAEHSVLVDSRNRVHAISLIHELLYKSSDLSGISIKGYLSELVGRIESSLLHNDAVSIVMQVGDYHFDADTCVACGLLLNELLTNSLKHAFPHGESGVILIRVDQVEDGSYLLELQDDGVGMSRDHSGRETLGLRLVRALTEQLGGTLTVESGEGTLWRIRFAAEQVLVQA